MSLRVTEKYVHEDLIKGRKRRTERQEKRERWSGVEGEREWRVKEIKWGPRWENERER